MNRYDYIQVYDWMRVVYELTGYDLLVYAYIYNLVEVTPLDLETYTGVPKRSLKASLKKLEDGGLIKWRKKRHRDNLPPEMATLFYANPEFCL